MARTARTRSTDLTAAAWFSKQSFHSFITAPTTGAILDALLADSRPTEAYQLPSGDIVDIYADVSRGQAEISYTLIGGQVVTAHKLDAADDHRAEDARLIAERDEELEAHWRAEREGDACGQACGYCGRCS